MNFLMVRGAERRSVASVETTSAVTGRDGKNRQRLIIMNGFLDVKCYT